MVCESRMMYGAEIWGLDEGRKFDIIHGRLCKKILGIPRFAANGVADVTWEEIVGGARYYVCCEYRQRTLQTDKEELIRVCYKWQVNNLEFDSWARKLSKQLSKIGLGYIWQDLRMNTVCGISIEIKERRNDTKRQNLFANIKEKRSLIFYSVMKQGWATEQYIVCCTRNERSGLARFETGIWKLRGTRQGSEKGRCPLRSEDEDAIHRYLKCSETRKWREQFLSRKWLMLNEGIDYKKIISCTNTVELRSIEIYLHNIICKWENKIRNLSSELGSGIRTVVIR
jgi:hypothetical protein